MADEEKQDKTNNSENTQDAPVQSELELGTSGQSDLKPDAPVQRPLKMSSLLILLAVLLLCAVAGYFVKNNFQGGNSLNAVESVNENAASAEDGSENLNGGDAENQNGSEGAAGSSQGSVTYSEGEVETDYTPPVSSYKDLTKNCVFDAAALNKDNGDGTYAAVTGQQVIDIMGEPEEKKNWTYTGISGDYPVTSYYYFLEGGKSGKEPTLQFVFYEGGLMEVIVMDEIPFENKADILSLFNLKMQSYSEVVTDTEEQYRVLKCGIYDFWAYAVTYDKNGDGGRLVCYLRYFDL